MFFSETFLHIHPANTVKTGFRLLASWISTSVFIEFCRLTPPNLKRYDTPPHTHGYFILFCQQKNAQDLFYWLWWDIDIFDWAIFTALSNNFSFSCSRIFLRHANMSVVQKILLFSSKPFNFYHNCRISVAPANFHGQYSGQTRIYSLYDASTNYSGRFDSLLYRKKEQIAVSCSISIAKVVCGSTATLTMLWRNSWSITEQTHKKWR